MEETFIIVPTSFITELKLDGKELFIYSVIYSFSKDGRSSFYGSWKYLSKITGASRTSVYNALTSLTKKGLIVKEDIIENNVKRCRYYATSTRPNIESAPVQELNHPVQELNHTRSEIEPYPVQELNPYYNNKEESKEREGASASPQPRPQSSNGNSTSKGFKKPTLEEVKAYIKEKQLNADGETFYDYYESVGWYVGKNKMKNWKASLNNWSRRESKFNMQNCSKQSMVTYAPVEFNNF